MKAGLRKATILAGASCLVGGYLAVPMVANAAGGTPIPFSAARFAGYGSGTEVQLAAVTLGTTSLAQVGQAVSSASVNSAGLTAGITAETGNTVNPALPASIKAYGSGYGLGLGLGATPAQEQALLAGMASASSPPIGPVVDKRIGPINLAPILTASALDGRAAAVYDPTGVSCPIGQPISYGRGDAANVQLLSLLPNSVPVANTAGSATAGTTTANSTSQEFLSSNGDGSFGLTSEASEIIAPITVDLLGIATLKVTVAGTTPNSPVILDAVTTGGPTGASVKLDSNDVINITLAVGTGAPTSIASIAVSALGVNGLHIDLNTATLGSGVLQPLLGALVGAVGGVPLLQSLLGPTLTNLLGPTSSLGTLLTNLLNGVGGGVAPIANLSLGSLDLDANPHAIGGSVTSAPTIVGGTEAAGAVDLIHLNLGLSGSILSGTGVPTGGITLPNIGIANLYVGHLETAAALNASVNCPIPMIKTVNPSTLTAGNSFVYTILVPDPAKLALVDCNLSNVSIVDTIADQAGSGKATFQVMSAVVVSVHGGTTTSTNGTIVQSSPTSATVSWSGLNYDVGDPPLDATIKVAVPANSPSGVIEDIANSAATANGCSGGISGVTNLGGVNGSPLTGTTNLLGPTVQSVTSVVKPPNTTSQGQNPPTTPSTLPRTGGEGGLWQPGLGVGLLALAGGALNLVRRTRKGLLG